MRISSLTRLAWMAVFSDAHAPDAQPHQPIVILAEGGEQLLGIGQRRQLVRRVAARETQREAVVHRREGKAAEIPGGGDHVAVVIVTAVAQLVEHQGAFAAEVKQLDLLLLASRLEIRNGIRQRHDLALERQVGLDQLIHARFHGGELFLRERPAVDHRAIETARGQRVINGNIRLGEGVLEGGLEQEGDRAAVDA